MARGLAGAALFAVPVAVAALIGFGSGFAGVAGGLSSVTNGPDPVPASAQSGPTRLSRVVVALASRQTTSSGSAGRGDSSGGSTGTTSPSGSGDTSGSSGDSSGTQAPTIDSPTAPNVSLPGSDSGGAVGGATNIVNGAANNVVGGVNDTLNGLLGGK